VHVSVGDILRSREGDGSELGQQVGNRRDMPIYLPMTPCAFLLSPATCPEKTHTQPHARTHKHKHTHSH
jgi:hypothetical protein